jgi:serine/threonine protein kinase
MQKRVLSAEEVVEISRQICKGLDYAHSLGIVHRDVKPANIMITSDGTVKIMDFGIAKTGGGVTSTGQVLGTPNYMSPEQVKGKQLDGRSDLFSFGVVLYEMITGEKPFVGENVTTIIYKIVNESPTAPRDLDVTVHPGLSSVVTKALNKSPDERYQSGADLVKDLENYKSIELKPGVATSASVGNEAQGEQTLVLPVRSGNTVSIPAPAAAPAKSKGSLWIVVMSAVLLLAIAATALGLNRFRFRARQLEEAKKEQEKQQSENIVPARPDTSNTTQQPSDQKPKPESTNKPAEQKPKTKPVNTVISPNLALTHQGELRFASQPDGAKVEVDGWSEPAWITPFKASNLSAGQHTIVFTKPGYMQETRVIQVVAGKSEPVSAQLTTVVSSTLRLNSTPQNALIWIDGRDTGKTTPAELTVEKGPHRVVLRKPGYKEAFTQVKLSEGETYIFTPTLTFQQAPEGFWRRLLGSENIPVGKGVLHIRTIPAGATIIINGSIAPRKTDVRWVLPPGSYDLTLEKDGFRTVHRRAEVEVGKVQSVDEILETQAP